MKKAFLQKVIHRQMAWDSFKKRRANLSDVAKERVKN
jgi:hypothetical protein